MLLKQEINNFNFTYLALHFFVYNHVSIKKTGNDTYVKTNNNKDIKVDSSCMEAKKTARLSS